MNPEDNITRRSFLVAVGTTVLGHFFLPPTSASPSRIKLPPVATTMGIELEQTRVLLTVPRWDRFSWGFRLMWIEYAEAKQKRRVMVWGLTTEEEVKEGKRLFEAAIGVFARQGSDGLVQVAKGKKSYEEAFGHVWE